MRVPGPKLETLISHHSETSRRIIGQDSKEYAGHMSGNNPETGRAIQWRILLFCQCINLTFRKKHSLSVTVFEDIVSE